MSEIIKVGMADLNVCKSPDGITTLGLGSCVGVAIRDPITSNDDRQNNCCFGRIP